MSNENIRPHDDEARVSRLSSADASVNGDEAVSPPDPEQVVREYQTRYYGEQAPLDDLPRVDQRKQRDTPRSYSTLRVSDDDRLWAAVAHASAWLSLLAGLFSAGTLLPITIFVPLAIYFVFRRKSDYIAFHALQAFVLQLIGTVGALALLIVGGIVWTIGMVIAAVLVIVLIGFILVPLWALVGIVLFGVVALMPLIMAFFGTYAAIETYNGRDYRYPIIARWVDRQLAGGYLHTV